MDPSMPTEVPSQSSTGGSTFPAVGSPVPTACGGIVAYTSATPYVEFRGKAVYFCLPACKDDYDRDPGTSCLAARLLNTE